MMGEGAEYQAVIASPLPGSRRLGVKVSDKGLTAIDFLASDVPLKEPRLPLAKLVVAELQDYFANPKTRFTVPLDQGGTPYQKKVWEALREIPVGKTVSYGTLAQELSTGPRAVAGACRCNPIPLIVPCHRVVAAGGLGGYSGERGGSAIEIKQWLLEHEGVSGRR